MKKFIAIIFFLTISCFRPGSYPYASKYEIDISETELAFRIEVFKNENIGYKVPEGMGLEDGRRTDGDHWYHVYFKNPAQNQIIKTWIREKSKSKTIFAFVGIKDYSNKNNGWRLINKDYEDKENKMLIEEFEKKILSQLNIDFIPE